MLLDEGEGWEGRGGEGVGIYGSVALTKELWGRRWLKIEHIYAYGKVKYTGVEELALLRLLFEPLCSDGDTCKQS